MVIIGLKSAGLGNCMFQYAAARSLAERNNTVVKIDLTCLNKQQMPYNIECNHRIHRLFEKSLGVFNINYELAKKGEIRRLKGWVEDRHIYGTINKRLRSAFNYFPKSYFNEKVIHEFDKAFFDNKGDTYLDGTFINPKYFQNIEKIIRSDFTFKPQQTGRNLELAREIRLCESVSIHVRRGDYVDKNQTKDIYPIYGLDYYRRAVNIIQSKIANPRFYIFSDDIQWSKVHLKFIDNCTFVDHNSLDEGFEDLRLMSECRHSVITNSTFSWWGAWLNPRRDRLVISPRKWRNDNIDTSDLLLEYWITI